MERSGPQDRFETLAVHAGADPDPLTGAVVPAIQMSATFKQDGVGGTRLGYEYGRSDNPTRRALETAIAALEGAPHGLAYASGLAATQNVFYLLDPGDRRRPDRGRQHVRHAVPAAPAGPRRRRSAALDDEVPGRSLGRDRRRGGDPLRRAG